MSDLSAKLSVLGQLYGATPADLAQAERALMAAGSPADSRGSATGAAPVRPTLTVRGEPLPQNSPEFSGIDRWTMLELWSRAAPAQYANLLRAPVLPQHPGQATLPRPEVRPRQPGSRYDESARRHRHTKSGKFVPTPS